MWQRLVGVDERFASMNNVFESARMGGRVMADVYQMQAGHPENVPQEQNIIRQGGLETSVSLLVVYVLPALLGFPPGNVHALVKSDVMTLSGNIQMDEK